MRRRWEPLSADRPPLAASRGEHRWSCRARGLRRASIDREPITLAPRFRHGRDRLADRDADVAAAGLGCARAVAPRLARPPRRSRLRRGARPLQHALRFRAPAGRGALLVGERRSRLRHVRLADRRTPGGSFGRPQLRRMVDGQRPRPRHRPDAIGASDREPNDRGRRCAADRSLRDARGRAAGDRRGKLPDRRHRRPRARWGHRRPIAPLGLDVRRSAGG